MTLCVALMLLAAGFAVAAWTTSSPRTASAGAALFPATPVDLTLSGPRGVDAFLAAGNLAPGDVIAGELVLAAEREGPADAYDLDVVLRFTEGGREHPLAGALRVTRLTYDGRDLLGLPGAPSAIADLARGLADLPTPRPMREGGTPLAIELTFHPAAPQDAHGGEPLGVAFHFLLAETGMDDLT